MKMGFNLFGDVANNIDNDETNIYEIIISILSSIYSSAKNHYKLIFPFTALVSLIAVIYSYYFAPIIFQSQITMIPLAPSSSNTNSLASQFGFSSSGGGSEIGSVQLIPDLIRLRSLHRSVLIGNFILKITQKKSV